MTNAELNEQTEGRIFKPALEIKELANTIIQCKSLGLYLFEKLDQHNSDREIAVDFASGRTWTGGQLRDAAMNVACALVDHFDLKPGTVVCISYDNSDLTLILSLAIIFAGGVVACAYSKDPYAELLYLARKVEPKLLFCHERNIGWAQRIENDLGYPVRGIIMDEEVGDQPLDVRPIRHFQQLLHYDRTKSISTNLLPVAVRDMRKHVALITMSSGTTGKPKAVPVTHWNCIADLAKGYQELQPQLNMACVSSLDYVSGRIIAFGAIKAGYRVIILDGFQPRTYLEAIERYRVNILYLGAAAFYNLITYEEVDKYDLSAIRVVFPMGAKIIYLKELSDFFKKHPNILKVIQGFGSSETSGGAMHSRAPEEYLKDCENCGPLMPNVEAKIKDQTSGRLLGTNQLGILCLRSQTVFPGYYDKEQWRKSEGLKAGFCDNNDNCDHEMFLNEPPFVADSEVIDEDGFYVTGDLAYFNDQEQLYMIGRQKEMMHCRASKKVLPQELEEVIGEHPAVAKVCVLGIPNRRELTLHCPCAFIVPNLQNLNGNRTLNVELKSLKNRSEAREGREEQLAHRGEHKLTKLGQVERRQLAEDLMSFVNERVGWEKQLTGGIVILDEIPISRATGKMDKNYLRSLSLDCVEIYGDRSS